MIKSETLAPAKREIFRHYAGPDEKTIVFLGGIHGNEMEGVHALENVFDSITQNNIPIKGNVYAWRGNLHAIEKHQRFVNVDLNRIWTTETISEADRGLLSEQNWGWEFNEFKALQLKLSEVFTENNNQIVFADLHSTSSPACPFIPINDTLANRELALRFPVPVVWGIEEFLNGPLMSYINELGHIAIGFEGGQIGQDAAKRLHESFIWLLMDYVGIIELEDQFKSQHLSSMKKATNGYRGVYDIHYRHEIKPIDSFKMKKGFSSFETVKKGELLAVHNGMEIKASMSGYIFMPLYQNKGEDGYYLIEKVGKFWIVLSKYLRRTEAERLLILLPGVRRSTVKTNSLIVNLKLARFLTKPLFHLLGYRIWKSEGSFLLVSKRDF